MVLPYDQRGSGPVIILLHAGVADRRMMRPHLDPLAEAGFRVIAPDLPGYGEASVEPGEQAVWLDVLETLDSLSIKEALVVGNSFGGAVALRLAHVAPHRVSGLVLISAPSPALEPSAELDALWASEESALERGDIDLAVDLMVAAWTLPTASEEIVNLVATMQRRAYELQLVDSEVTEGPDPLEQDPEAIRQIDVPTLVAVGQHDMSDFSRSAVEMVDALPNAQHTIIEGAGHLAPLEVPDEFRELVLNFASGQPSGMTEIN